LQSLGREEKSEGSLSAKFHKEEQIQGKIEGSQKFNELGRLKGQRCLLRELSKTSTQKAAKQVPQNALVNEIP